jgi:diacylglycerol kinase
MMKFLKSGRHAMDGLRAVFSEERNFKIEIVLGILVFLIAFAFRFTPYEIIAVVMAIIIVLAAEIVNTAVEDLCDKVESSQNPTIGKIKDMMAGYVLVSCGGAALIGLLVFLSHFEIL